jgi:hypothetical protein
MAALFTPSRWRMLTAIGVIITLAAAGVMYLGTAAMIWHHAGKRCIVLHYGAVGIIRGGGMLSKLDPLDGDAWHMEWHPAASLVTSYEHSTLGGADSIWIPLWPTVAASALFSLGCAAMYLNLHWSICRRCGYRRHGLDYHSPCPECGENSRAYNRRW